MCYIISVIYIPEMLKDNLCFRPNSREQRDTRGGENSD